MNARTQCMLYIIYSHEYTVYAVHTCGMFVDDVKSYANISSRSFVKIYEVALLQVNIATY